MAERLDIAEAPQRLSDVQQMQNAENEPEVMRLGDLLSSEKVVTEELNEAGFFQVTDTQRREWEGLGEIGYFEQAIRQDKTEMIPFNPEGAVKSVKLLNAVNRVKRDKYGEDPGQKDVDTQLINNFLRMSEEERIRGYTVGGRITQGVAALPGFMVEFLATGGAAAIGKKGIKAAVSGVTRKIVQNKALKFATRVTGGVAGAVARTAAMPHRVVEGYADRQISATLEFTDEGLKIAQESREKPFISFSKAFGDVVIENFSEVTGPTLGKIGAKIIPKRMADGMIKLWKKLHPNEAINKIFTKLGYHGFLEELGEERVGALLRAVTGVEDFGAKDADRMFDRIMASIPNGEEMLVEAGVLAFPGAMQAGTQQALEVVRNRGREAGQEVKEPDLPETVPNQEIEEIAAIEPEKAPISPEPGVGEPGGGVKGVTPALWQYGAEPAAAIPGEPIAFYSVEGEDFATAKAQIIYDEIDGETLGYKIELRDGTILPNPKSEKVGGSPYFETFEEAQRHAEQHFAEGVGVKDLIDRYEGGEDKQISSIEDVVDGVEDIISERMKNREDTDADAKLQKAIDKFRKEQEYDRKLSGRGDMDTARDKIMEAIEKYIKPTKAPVKPFAQRIQEIKETFKRPETIARKEVKAVQEEIIRELEASDLEAADKAKFIKTIKNIQTAEQLQKALPEIETRMARLEVAESKRSIARKIKKELKATKPAKVGQRRVAKFDYESSKLFDALRDYNKLSQSKAQEALDKLPEEPGSELELVKARFLSLKANGAAASLQIYQLVAADIARIKELGKKAKSEADMEKALNRQERVESALSSIDKITGNKKSIMGKIANFYRRGFTNIGSMLNSIGGLVFSKAYDPELSENRRNTATYKKTVEMTQNASTIYNEKNIMRLFETMSKMDYKITDLDGLTTELSKLELIDIYNSIKNDKKKADYYEAFSKGQILDLMGALTENDTRFGDSMQETVQSYRDILNARNIETTGRDLGFIENYWPGSSEFQVSVIDDMRVQGETPSAAKERAKTRVIPIPRNAWYKAGKHIDQAEHVKNVSRQYEALKRLFNDRKVKHAIKEKYGEDVYNTISAQIENISLNKQTERIDAISSLFQKAINNWVLAKIAANPSTYVRQLMSVGNYVEVMSATKWAEDFSKGLSSPRATFEYMWKNAPFLEARFNKGHTEAIQEAIKGAESIGVNKKIWTKSLTSLVRSGDITAIIYGGYPLMLDKGLDAFESATLKAQQSGLASSLSQFQNSKNPFTRLFLAFKNTSNQYFRKMADAVISYQNKDISLGQFTKTMAIYAVIQPIMYVAGGYATKVGFGAIGRTFGFRDDEEDWEELLEKFLNDVMIQMIVSPVNAMPIIDDIMRTAARKLTDQDIYKVFSTPLFDDLERGIRGMTKIEVTGADYLGVTTSILEPLTAAPIGTAIRYYEILTGKKIGGKQKSTRPNI